MGDQDKSLTRRSFFQKSSKTLLVFGSGALLASTTTVWAASGCVKTSNQCDALWECPCVNPNDATCTRVGCTVIV